jgi:hypothetical protein
MEFPMLAAACAEAVEYLSFPVWSDVPLPGLATAAQHEAAVVDGADPPVWLSEPGAPDEIWLLVASRFSAYVYAEAWDIACGSLPHYALGYVPFGDADLAFLQREFMPGAPGPDSAGHGGVRGMAVHRFERRGQRVRVDPESLQWWLAADSVANLERLMKLLSKANAGLGQALRRER